MFAIKRIIQRLILKTSTSLKYPIAHYRERIFNIISFTFFISAALPLIIGVYTAIKFDMYAIAIFDIGIYILLGIITFYSGIALVYRKRILTTLPYFAGVFFLFSIGPGGPGFAYLVGFNILGAVLLGKRAAISSLTIIFITLLLITAFIYFGAFGNTKISDYSALGFFAAGINLLLIGSVSAIPLTYLVGSLEKRMLKQQTLQKRLRSNIAELTLAKTKAEESDLLKSKFLSNMSHEIRTPLNSIIGFSNIIRDMPEMNGQKRAEMLQKITDSGDYLLRIMQDILDISQIDSEQMTFYFAKCDLHHIIESLKNTFRKKPTVGTSITFFKIQPGIIILNTDEARVRQIFIHLLSNALKFASENINVDYRLIPEHIEFSVQDKGKGIPEKELGYVFKRFVKGKDEFSDMSRGTGLGLSIAKATIEKLGGSIRVESKVDEGSTFYFTLPYRKN